MATGIILELLDAHTGIIDVTALLGYLNIYNFYLIIVKMKFISHQIKGQIFKLMVHSYSELWSFKIIKLDVWKPCFVKFGHNC